MGALAATPRSSTATAAGFSPTAATPLPRPTTRRPRKRSKRPKGLYFTTRRRHAKSQLAQRPKLLHSPLKLLPSLALLRSARLQRLQTHVRSTTRRRPPTSRSQLLSQPQLVSPPAAPSSTPAARRHLTKSQRSSTSTLGWLSISKATLTPRRDHSAKNWWTAVLKAPRSTWLPRVARTR